MAFTTLDTIDEGSSYLLQVDARRSITDVVRRLNVADNTVRNRLERLEAEGVIDGYAVDIDYTRAGVQHH